MMESHSTQLVGEGNICFSDYCEMLGCPSFTKKEVSSNPSEQQRKLAACRAVWNQCFPMSEGRLARENQDLFTRKFCQKFMSGEGARKADLLLEKHNAEYDNLVVLKYLGFGFLVMVLIVYYLLICLWRNETIATPLMKGRGSAGGGGSLAWLSWMTRQRKEKGY